MSRLYAAILTYIARVKSYFAGNTWRRISRSLIEAMRKSLDELWKQVSEAEVDKWSKLVDAEHRQTAQTRELEHYESLGTILFQLDKPIVQLSDKIATIQDTFDKEERKRIFRWMSEIEYRSHHDDLSKGLLPDSGKWLLGSKQFIEWGQSSVSSILWLHGIRE